MSSSVCDCGANGTHRCTHCTPRATLCRDCVAKHLQVNTKDSIIPIQTSPTPSSEPCDKCLEPAVYLQVLADSTVPICKRCKKLMACSDNTSICIPIKWKEIVTKSQDIQEIYSRGQIENAISNELANNLAEEEISEILTNFKNAFVEFVNAKIADKITKCQKAKNGEPGKAHKIMAEVRTQLLKKVPDVDTETGKIVDSYMRGFRCRVVKAKEDYSFLSDLYTYFEKTLDRVNVEATSSKYNIYFFNPGKPVLLKIDLEKMKKYEITFERNWIFEASWCELANGQLFMCGGNGINNSEVLVIDINNKKVTEKHPFTGRSGHGIIQIDDFVYVFGGSRGNYAEKFDLCSNSWTNLCELPYKLSKISICRVPEGVFMTGIDCCNILEYNILTNTYKESGSPFYTAKNKIVFDYKNCVYCMCGEKLFISDDRQKWNIIQIPDRDWWSYSRPVIFNNCVYFIKYFVRNLWRLNLETHHLEEIYLSELEYILNI